MGWLTDAEVASIRACRAEECAPAAFELQHLLGQLSEPAARERAVELLTAFKAVVPKRCPDVWYGQLEQLQKLARALDDIEAEVHAAVVNRAVREASRTSVWVVRSEDQKFGTREEMRAMAESGPEDRAEIALAGRGILAPACDLAEVLEQGGPLICQRVRDAGYTVESKPLGRQGAVPSPRRLAWIKEQALAALTAGREFVQSARNRFGVDVVAQFRTMLQQPFRLEPFCALGSDGISVADLYTMLPMILDARQQRGENPLWELEARFMAFRLDFGTMCNPLEDYMPIFEAVFELFRRADAELMKTHGASVIRMFRSIFTAVLDLLAGSVEVINSSLGTGLSVVIGALGAGSVEVAGLAGDAAGLLPVAAFVAGAAFCALAVKGVVCVVDSWLKRSGKNVRVCALFRRSDTYIWRVWVIELIQ